MIVCLSSGFTPRYRHDVFRAISMPKGTRLRLRYERDLIPIDLRGKLRDNMLRHETVCIAYLDRTEKSQTPSMIPCRAAEIVETKSIGDFFLLELELESFYLATDIAEFNRSMSAAVDTLPRWKHEQLVGFFCHEVDSNALSLSESTDIADWQRLVEELKLHRDFAAEPFFYFAYGVFSPGSPACIETRNGAFSVLAGQSYEIRLIQYSPGETNDTRSVERTNLIVATAVDSAISFTTNNSLNVDSGYDEKLIRFKTVAGAITSQDSVVSLLRRPVQDSSRTEEASTWDFDIYFDIRPRHWPSIVRAVLIGIPLALTQLVTLWANPQVADKTSNAILILLLSFLTGVGASYGIKKVS